MTTRPTVEQCGGLATFTYTWPGRDEAVICVECAEKLTNVANAIGMHLQLIPITGESVDDPMDWPTCPQKKQA